MRRIIGLAGLLFASATMAQVRLELAVPYDGTTNNFVRLVGLRVCDPTVYRIDSATLTGRVIDLQVRTLQQGNGCPFTFAGRPTETESFLSLADALGDHVILPPAIEIRVFTAGELVALGTFARALTSANNVPLENGCYSPRFRAVCIERHLERLHLNLEFYPFVVNAPVGQPNVHGVPLIAETTLRNNYARLELFRSKGLRTIPSRVLPEGEMFGTARVALLSPNRFVFQFDGEPSFVAVQAPWLAETDWKNLGNGSRWLLSLNENNGIFGGFKIAFGASNSVPDFVTEGSTWQFPATWDFGNGRLACTPAGCHLYLGFSSSGPEFLFAHFPSGGLGVGGMYAQFSTGGWKRLLIRSED